MKTFSFCTPTVIELDGATQVISPGSGFVCAVTTRRMVTLRGVRYGEGYSVVPRTGVRQWVIVRRIGIRSAQPAGDRSRRGQPGDATDKHVAWTPQKACL